MRASSSEPSEWCTLRHRPGSSLEYSPWFRPATAGNAEVNEKVGVTHVCNSLTSDDAHLLVCLRRDQVHTLPRQIVVGVVLLALVLTALEVAVLPLGAHTPQVVDEL